MTRSLPTLTDDEISRCPSTSEEAGFGSLATPRGHLPLKAMDVRARIDGLLAHLTLTQTFVNTHDEPLEATYVFPLPDRAAVILFRMQVAGRVIEGQLKERGQARQDYDRAMQAGQRAAIAEEDRSNVFTLRVGNLMPGEEACVRLNLAGSLPCSDGEATFRFPLVVAPRYIPGRPLAGPNVGAGTASDTDAVPDASRITPPVLLPGYPNPVRLSLTVDVHPSALPLGEFRCSLHSVLEAADDAGVRRIVLQPGERLNRDFILRFRLGEQTVRSGLLLKPDRPGGREGTFALTLVPPVGLAQAQRPRDVVFILDRSGSMGGWKMVAARRALARMVETLTDRDRFSVYAFDDRIETPVAGNAGLLPATDQQRCRAVAFLSGIEARGGTEMAQPLDLAVHTLKGIDPQREGILVLVTDGQVGNEDQILRHLGPHVGHLRIFTLGIDRAVNEGFLHRLAALGRGTCQLVESERRLDEVMAQVHRHIGTPVLTNLHLEPTGFQIVMDSLAPARMPDLFAGTPLCLLGRYQGVIGSVVLQARDVTGEPWSATLRAEVCDNPAVGSVWARLHLRELEDRFVIKGGDAALEKRIVETSLRFGVLCRFTAFVAVDQTEVVNTSGQVHQVTQAVETPAGWEMLEKGRDSQKATSARRRSLSGPRARRQTEPEKDPRAAKKTLLAKQVLPEINTGGRVSKRTQMASGDKARGAPYGQDQASKDQIRQLTTDHSTSQALVESRTLTPEEADRSRFRNVLWRYLGNRELGGGLEVSEVPLTPGDRFLLCSDGLTGVVSDERLLRFIREHPDVQACADGLAQLALDSGSRDNISCIVLEFGTSQSLSIGLCTLVGNYRESNEDTIEAKQFPDWMICLVADGMGGKSAGEVASKRAIEVILRELRRLLDAASTADQIKDVIRQAVLRANEEIIALGALAPALKNIGSTIVLTAWRRGSSVMYVTNVGDSRCYHVPPNK
jgi:Ca-activated chloride channel family protein